MRGRACWRLLPYSGRAIDVRPRTEQRAPASWCIGSGAFPTMTGSWSTAFRSRRSRGRCAILRGVVRADQLERASRRRSGTACSTCVPSSAGRCRARCATCWPTTTTPASCGRSWSGASRELCRDGGLRASRDERLDRRPGGRRRLGGREGRGAARRLRVPPHARRVRARPQARRRAAARRLPRAARHLPVAATTSPTGGRSHATSWRSPCSRCAAAPPPTLDVLAELVEVGHRVVVAHQPDRRRCRCSS